tara:strand:+ start:109 stop:597 length:489 start_codon:yes stop_codon:yes gene_type:complete
MAYKMKGSPMARNFGIGTSPTKQVEGSIYKEDQTDGATQITDGEGKVIDNSNKKTNTPPSTTTKTKTKSNTPPSTTTNKNETVKTKEREEKGADKYARVVKEAKEAGGKGATSTKTDVLAANYGGTWKLSTDKDGNKMYLNQDGKNVLQQAHGQGKAKNKNN